MKEHNTESADCWCHPEVKQVCPLCRGHGKKSCRRCDGHGLVDVYDRNANMIVVHRDDEGLKHYVN